MVGSVRVVRSAAIITMMINATLPRPRNLLET